MPVRKKSAKPAKKAAKTKPRAHASTTQVSGRMGTFTVARGHVTIGVPAFWTFRQTNEDLQVESPTGDTSVIVTAYERNTDGSSLDARTYLDHFLANAPHQSRIQRNGASKSSAAARYRDPDGHNWIVQFMTNGSTLLLAELSTSKPLNGREAKLGMGVLESVALKRKR